MLKALATKVHVKLIVEAETEPRRIKDQWAMPDFGSAELHVKPGDETINELLKADNSVHIFSGVSSYPYVHNVFKKAVAQKLRIGIMTEPYDWIGFKGLLRRGKYFLFNLQYSNSIDFILAIGHKGRECLQAASFSSTKIYDWGYFTESSPRETPPDSTFSGKPRLIYVGRLSKGKGILGLIELCRSLENSYESITIIGHGSEEFALRNLIAGRTKFHFLGAVSNNAVMEAISSADLMVLPSIAKDGWGAVINESLMLGIPVITSDYCGASVLLDGKIRGEVFSVSNNNLEDVLKRWLQKGKLTLAHRKQIQQWAKEHISGEEAAKYLLKIVDYNYSSGNIDLPVAPWLKNADATS